MNKIRTYIGTFCLILTGYLWHQLDVVAIVFFIVGLELIDPTPLNSTTKTL